MLLDKYMVQALFPGAMLSESVLNKYLKLTNGGKKDRIKKMQKYSSWITKVPPELYNVGLTPAQIAKRKEWFKALSVSPVYVNDKCPYIPSFSDLLNGTVDQNLLDFASLATKSRRAELDYWNV